MSPFVLLSENWLILPEALETLAGNPTQPNAFFDLLKAPPKGEILTVENGVATINIDGPLMRKPDAWDRVMNGAADMGEIADALRSAGTRPDVRAVMLNIDSPGGTVAGTPELAASVDSLAQAKPVYAFTSGLMASAAYWIGSQAKAIYATSSARVGSIGVVQAVVDRTAQLEKAGVKVEVFTVGKFKAMGAPGTQLTDEHRAHIQANLQDIAAEFHQAITSRRPGVPASAMEGQAFHAKSAEKNKLITGVVPDYAAALANLRQRLAVG